LLALMKTFGKQLWQPKIAEFIQINYPEASALYHVLGKSTCNRAICLRLKSYLRDYLQVLDVTLSHWDIVHHTFDVFSQAKISYSDGSVLPGMTVWSQWKVYRRSIKEDLSKFAFQL
jgi:hypothetical protein